MGYDKTTGKLSAPIEMAEISECIGVGSLDLGTLCTSANIQKMSKIKPINYPENGIMSADKFRGTLTDIGNGIIYGLKVGLANNILYNVHNADWSYVGRPTGGIGVSPYRQLDFNGYHHNAVPTMYGDGLQDGMEISFTSTSTLLNVYLRWVQNNTTGVSPLEMVWGSGEEAQKSQTYLYIVIDNYMTMLYNGAASNGARPIYSNGTEWQNFSCPPLPSALQTAATRKVSIVMGPYLSDRQPGTWIELNSTSVPAVSGKFVTLPYAVNIGASFKVLVTQSIVFENMTLSLPSDNQITFSWTEGKDWSSYASRRIVVSVYKVAGGKPTLGSGTYTITVGDVTSITELVGAIMSAAGWVPMTGDVYTIEALFQFYNNNNIWETQGQAVSITKQY